MLAPCDPPCRAGCTARWQAAAAPFPRLPLSGHLGKQVMGISRSAGRTMLLPNQISPLGTSPAELKLPITFPAEALILQTEGRLLPDK